MTVAFTAPSVDGAQCFGGRDSSGGPHGHVWKFAGTSTWFGATSAGRMSDGRSARTDHTAWATSGFAPYPGVDLRRQMETFSSGAVSGSKTLIPVGIAACRSSADCTFGSPAARALTRS